MKNWKRGFALALSVFLALSLSACASGGPESSSQENVPEPQEVTLAVFAAASLQETLTEIGEQYREIHPNVTLLFNFDSSGTLKTQIQEGAECDVFLSAGQLQMNQLDASVDSGQDPSAQEPLDFVERDTRVDLLENKVVLTVPDGNPEKITSFQNLAERLRTGDVLVAVGGADVPVGQYTRVIFQSLGFRPEALAESGLLTYGSNVKEVAAQVAEAAVDCGIIYATDAFSAGLAVVDTAGPELCGRVIYPAAVLNTSARPEEARAFLDFLFSAQAREVFEGVGFTPLP